MNKLTYLTTAFTSLFLFTGCGSNTQIQSAAFLGTVPHYLKVTKTDYNSTSHEVQIHASSTSKKEVHSLSKPNENILDTETLDGIVNYATTQYAGKSVNRVSVFLETTGTNVQTLLSVPVHNVQASLEQISSTQGNVMTQRQTAPIVVSAAGTVQLPPPGVRIDNGIQPMAGLNASRSAKLNAIMKVALSKMGTPYIWGHNEDRGQSGFDCSNFTEYVYHHALGYSFSTASRTQYSSVGYQVPINQLQPGDLLCFDNGRHVGIYAGNNRVIQEGGGLAKVGYLKYNPGSYWYNHTTAVKRMF